MNRLFKAILTCGLPILNGYLFKIVKYNKHKEKYPIEKRYNYIRHLIKKAFDKIKIKVIFQGEEYLGEDSALIVCNHLSSMDPALFIYHIEHPLTVVAKKEVSSLPFVGTALSSIDGLLMDRQDLKQSLRVMMKVQNELETSNKYWLIFPEGTRNKDYLKNMIPFHDGTFRCAMKANKNIIPAAIYGSFRALKSKEKLKYYPVQIKLLKPITPEEYQGKSTKEVAEMVQKEIQKTISYELRPNDTKLIKELLIK